jgi:ribonuclease G
MAYEMIIDVGREGERIALLKDKKLVELHQESNESGNFLVGEIYLGKVKKIMPGLNAAFVDVGHEKDAFLHYHDLGPYIRSWQKITKETLDGSRSNGYLTDFVLEPETVKTGKISQVLKRNQQILVQVLKEPISTKGPRLTTEISIAGRYFILVPFYDTVNVSKKVSTIEERKRLKNLGSSLKTPKLGLICRTAAEQKGGQDLHQDILELQQKWENIFDKLPVANTTDRVLGEDQKSFAILRDLLSYDFASITVNQKQLYDDMKAHLTTIDAKLPKVLKYYSGRDDIFSQFGIDKQIQGSFGKTVSCSGGAYLIIEHTEALHSIDVNSGSKTASSSNQEENALAANLDAAREIARQLRLRDMGGIVVIDFIDLRTPNFKKQLYNTLRDAMEDDKAKHTILPMSKFGLIQITRQRVRPEMSIKTAEKCPTCLGTGSITSSVMIIDDIEQHVEHLLTVAKQKSITILTNPYLAAYLKQGMISKRLNWLFKYKTWVKIKADIKQGMLDYSFFDAQDEVIDIAKP